MIRINNPSLVLGGGFSLLLSKSDGRAGEKVGRGEGGREERREGRLERGWREVGERRGRGR